MSGKPGKPPKRGVSVASLSQPDKEGFLTKEGGSWKSWKRRWFVLKGDCLYYFKNQKDIEETGYIQLTSTSFCREEAKKGKKNCFSVFPTPDLPQSRQYFMYPDTPAEAQQWLNAINAAIERKKAGNAPQSSSQAASPPQYPSSVQQQQPQYNDSYSKQPASGGGWGGGKSQSANPRTKLSRAKDNVNFLQDPESKVLEFWQIWSESIPAHEELQPGSGMAIDYHVSVSANMQKLTWRTAGPQNIFIQKMVDFFWNVGAPESEIDRLNDVGALINPVKIGSWIDMSAKGGMDGGWYFPVEIPLKLGLEAADPGDPAMKLKAWADKYSIDKCFSVGRDMGAAPPRQTEFRLKVPGRDFPEQMRIAQDAYDIFGFPLPPNDVMSILRSSNPAYLCMSIITSSDGFVRLGLLSPKPSADVVAKLCTIAGGPSAQSSLSGLESAISAEGPAFVEYQYLKEGFGYGVYKEGFDVVLHYELGEETGDE